MRSPCTVVEDIVKAKAVNCNELSSFRNVLVVNVKDQISLAKKMSGGDFDGDNATVIWDPKIVSDVTAIDDERYVTLFAEEERLKQQYVGK